MNKRIRKKNGKLNTSIDREDYSDFYEWLGRAYLVFSAWQFNLDMTERAKQQSEQDKWKPVKSTDGQ